MEDITLKTCAICEKNIHRLDICGDCYNKYGRKGDFPRWLNELIKIHRSFTRWDTRKNRELVFSDVGLDLQGEINVY